MQSPGEESDIPIKNEALDDPTTFDYPESCLLKRPRSDHDQGGADKRQRIDLVPTIENENTSDTSPLSTTNMAVQGSEDVLQPFLAESSITTNCTQTTNHETSVPNGNGFISDPYLYMRIFSLPILESLSTQILATLAQGSYIDTVRIVQDPDSELGQAYATLKSLFDQTKQIYSKDGLFLSADELNIKEPAHRATIRTTNLASFSAAVFASSAGFYELSSSFIDIVTPDGACLEKEPGELLVNLKTQMYLSRIASEEQRENETKEDILEDMFPLDFEDVLRNRHPDTPLSRDELEFIDLVNHRREFLIKEHTDVESIQVLSEKFGWEGFLTDVSSYLKKNYEPLLAPYMKRHALTTPVSPRPTPDPNDLEKHCSPAYKYQGINGAASSLDQDISVHAQQAADEVLRALGYTSESQAVETQQTSHHSPCHTPSVIQKVPYPTQSAPTQELYEKARQAAASTKAGNVSARRPGAPSQRRPWSTEEENTLMAGLDQVKGPHWSQILAIYGQKGTINDILKDRNQVQLKDKARNLKLFFLKSGIEVPYYLQCVTGELKTRAPSQAAKREAEHRARLASGDEQMRQDSISALTGMASHGYYREPTGSFSSPEVSEYDGPEKFQLVEPARICFQTQGVPVAPVAPMIHMSD
ncbi:hypothetical protein LZ554_000915 [Drepanopeziza brunnea f. sp. 'monogermtubi']|nr:hypothetical protein LZ554_000915 [Drepanopeziza brunnea f. sp. 'monogermtubi']